MNRRKRRRRRPRPGRPELTAAQILAWADAYHGRTGRWPHQDTGRITGAIGETWANINHALRRGFRGLPGKSSLAQLLAEQRGVRNNALLPPYDLPTILRWADAYFRRHGRWPRHLSGPIPEAPGETWGAVENALRAGLRSLPGGSSLRRFLMRYRGVRNPRVLAPLTHAQILDWADAYHRRTGQWPTQETGPIAEAPGETWGGVQIAMARGRRQLPRGITLGRLLEEHRGFRNLRHLAPLSYDQILAWADAFHERVGHWPRVRSGPIAGGGGETWSGVNDALVMGLRGLPGGSTLIQLLSEHRGVRNTRRLPPLTPKQILAWADAFHEAHGRWPTRDAGPIAGTANETWIAVDCALRAGRRGLRGRSSLPQFLRMQGRGNPAPAGRKAPKKGAGE